MVALSSPIQNNYHLSLRILRVFISYFLQQLITAHLSDLTALIIYSSSVPVITVTALINYSSSVPVIIVTALIIYSFSVPVIIVTALINYSSSVSVITLTALISYSSSVPVITVTPLIICFSFHLYNYFYFWDFYSTFHLWRSFIYFSRLAWKITMWKDGWL